MSNCEWRSQGRRRILNLVAGAGFLHCLPDRAPGIFCLFCNSLFVIYNFPFMVAVHSTMLPLGTSAPDFALPDPVSGRTVRLADLAGPPALLVAFICNPCPFVVHIREPLVALIKEFQPRGLAAVAICSNDAAKYPEDSPGQSDGRRRSETGFYVSVSFRRIANSRPRLPRRLHAGLLCL